MSQSYQQMLAYLRSLSSDALYQIRTKELLRNALAINPSEIKETDPERYQLLKAEAEAAMEQVLAERPQEEEEKLIFSEEKKEEIIPQMSHYSDSDSEQEVKQGFQGFDKFKNEENAFLALQNYKREIDALEQTLEEQKEYECPKCEFTSQDRKQFFTHLRQQHMPTQFGGKARRIAEDVEERLFEEQSPIDIIAPKKQTLVSFVIPMDMDFPDRPKVDYLPSFLEDAQATNQLHLAYQNAKELENTILDYAAQKQCTRKEAFAIIETLYSNLNMLQQVRIKHVRDEATYKDAFNLASDIFDYFIGIMAILQYLIPQIFAAWTKREEKRYQKQKQDQLDVMEILKQIEQQEEKKKKGPKKSNRLQKLRKFNEVAREYEQFIKSELAKVEKGPVESNESVSLFLVYLMKNTLAMFEDPDFASFRRHFYADSQFLRWFSKLTLAQRMIIMRHFDAVNDTKQMLKDIKEKGSCERLSSSINYTKAIQQLQPSVIRGIPFIMQYGSLILQDYIAQGNWVAKTQEQALTNFTTFIKAHYLTSNDLALIQQDAGTKASFQELCEEGANYVWELKEKAQENLSVLQETLHNIRINAYIQLFTQIIEENAGQSPADDISEDELEEALLYVQSPTAATSDRLFREHKLNPKLLLSLACPKVSETLKSLQESFNEATVKNEAKKFKVEMETKYAKTTGSIARAAILEDVKGKYEAGEISEKTKDFLIKFFSVYENISDIPVQKNRSFTRLTRLEDFPKFVHSHIEREGYLKIKETEESRKDILALEEAKIEEQIKEKQAQRRQIFQQVSKDREMRELFETPDMKDYSSFTKEIRPQIQQINNEIYELSISFAKNDELLNELILLCKQYEAHRVQMKGFEATHKKYDPSKHDFINEFAIVKDRIRAILAKLQLGTYINVAKVIHLFEGMMKDRTYFKRKSSTDIFQSQLDNLLQLTGSNKNTTQLMQDYILYPEQTITALSEHLSAYSVSENQRLIQALKNDNLNPIYRAIKFYERSKVHVLRNPLKSHSTFPMRRARRERVNTPQQRIAKATDLASVDSFTDVAYRTKPWLRFSSEWEWFIQPTKESPSEVYKYLGEPYRTGLAEPQGGVLLPEEEKLAVPSGDVFRPNQAFWRWYYKSFVKRFKSDCKNLYHDFFLGTKPQLIFGLVNTTTGEKVRLNNSHFVQECKYFKDKIINKLEMIVGVMSRSEILPIEQLLYSSIQNMKTTRKLVLDTQKLAERVTDELIVFCQEKQCKFSKMFLMLFTLLYLLSNKNPSSYFKNIFITSTNEGLKTIFEDIYKEYFHKVLPEVYMANEATRQKISKYLRMIATEDMIVFAQNNQYLAAEKAAFLRESHKHDAAYIANQYNLTPILNKINADVQDFFVSSRKDLFRNLCKNGSQINGDVVFYYIDEDSNDLMCAGWEEIQTILTSANTTSLHGLSAKAVAQIRKTFSAGVDDFDAMVNEIFLYVQHAFPKITEDLMEEIKLLHDVYVAQGSLLTATLPRLPIIDEVVDKLNLCNNEYVQKAIAGQCGSLKHAIVEHIYNMISTQYWETTMNAMTSFLETAEGKQLLKEFENEAVKRAKSYGDSIKRLTPEDQKVLSTISDEKERKQRKNMMLRRYRDEAIMRSRNDRSDRYHLLQTSGLVKVLTDAHKQSKLYFGDNVVDYITGLIRSTTLQGHDLLTSFKGVADIIPGAAHENEYDDHLCDICQRKMYEMETILGDGSDVNVFKTVRICDRQECFKKAFETTLTPLSTQAITEGQIQANLAVLVASYLTDEQLFDLMHAIQREDLIDKYNVNQLWHAAVMTFNPFIFSHDIVAARADAINQLYHVLVEKRLAEKNVDLSPAGIRRKLEVILANKQIQEEIRSLLHAEEKSQRKLSNEEALLALLEPWTTKEALLDLVSPHLTEDVVKQLQQATETEIIHYMLLNRIAKWGEEKTYLPVSVMTNEVRANLIQQLYNSIVVNRQKTAEQYMASKEEKNPVTQFALLMENYGFRQLMQLILTPANVSANVVEVGFKSAAQELLPGCTSVSKDAAYLWVSHHMDVLRLQSILHFIQVRSFTNKETKRALEDAAREALDVADFVSKCQAIDDADVNAVIAQATMKNNLDNISFMKDVVKPFVVSHPGCIVPSTERVQLEKTFLHVVGFLRILGSFLFGEFTGVKTQEEMMELYAERASNLDKLVDRYPPQQKNRNDQAMIDLIELISEGFDNKNMYEIIHADPATMRKICTLYTSVVKYANTHPVESRTERKSWTEARKFYYHMLNGIRDFVSANPDLSFFSGASEYAPQGSFSLADIVFMIGSNSGRQYIVDRIKGLEKQIADYKAALERTNTNRNEIESGLVTMKHERYTLKQMLNVIQSQKRLTAYKVGVLLSGKSIPKQSADDIVTLNNMLKLTMSEDKSMVYQPSFLEELYKAFVAALQVGSETIKAEDITFAAENQALVEAAQKEITKQYGVTLPRKIVTTWSLKEEEDKTKRKLREGVMEDSETGKYYLKLKGKKKDQCGPDEVYFAGKGCYKEIDPNDAYVFEKVFVAYPDKTIEEPKGYKVEAPKMVHIEEGMKITHPGNMPGEGVPFGMDEIVNEDEFEAVKERIRRYYEKLAKKAKDAIAKEKNKKKKLEMEAQLIRDKAKWDAEMEENMPQATWSSGFVQRENTEEEKEAMAREIERLLAGGQEEIAWDRPEDDGVYERLGHVELSERKEFAPEYEYKEETPEYGARADLQEIEDIFGEGESDEEDLGDDQWE